MREELKAKQELDNIKKYGDPDPLNAAKNSDDILKEIDKFEKQAQNHQRKMQQSKKLMDKRYKYHEDTYYTPLSHDDKTELAYAQNQIAVQQAHDARDEMDKAWAELQKKREEMNALKKDGKIKESDYSAAVIIAKDLQKKAEAYEKAAEKYDASYKKLADTTEKYKELRDKIDYTVGNQANSIERQAEVHRLILKGRLEQANLLKIINSYKAKGLNIDEKDARIIFDQQKTLAKQQLLQKDRDSAYSLYLQAMKKNGYERQAMINQKLKSAYETKGSALSKKEVNRIYKLTDLELKLNNLFSDRIQSRGVKTNELAARGGFTRSIVKDNVKEVNLQILQQAKNANAILSEIRKLTVHNGKIQYTN